MRRQQHVSRYVLRRRRDSARRELAGTGCRFVGAYAPQNYSVTDSKVCEDGKFVGLAIDEADSEAVSSEHLKQWIAVLKEEGV